MSEDDKIVIFESYYDPMLAQIIRTRLEANGIPCFVSDYNTAEIIPYYNQAIGGVKLNVFEKDLDRCHEILAIDGDTNDEIYPEIDHETAAVIVCPYCGSNDVKYGTDTEVKFHLPSVLVSFFTGVPVYFRTAWHCFNCGETFQ